MRTRLATLFFAVVLVAVACVVLIGCGSSRSRTDEYNPYAYRAVPLVRQLEQLSWDGEWEGILGLWEQYGHLCESEVPCKLVVARANLELGRYEKAAQLYRESCGALEFWHNSDRDFKDLDVVVLGGVDETRCLRAAFDPSHSRAAHLLRAAESLLRVGACDEALETCDAIGECGLVTDPEMLMVKGEALFQLGEYRASTRAFRRALESLDEEHARARLRQMGEM